MLGGDSYGCGNRFSDASSFSASGMKCAEKCFMTYPEGYFNSSLAWEIGMTETLANRGFSYALVGEEGLRETFGVSTRISGWFVADRGVPMRAVPVALDLSDAASLGAMGIADKLNVFPESDTRYWIVRRKSAVRSECRVRFFLRLA